MRVGAEGAGDALMGESLAREGMGFSCRGKKFDMSNFLWRGKFNYPLSQGFLRTAMV